MKPKKVVLIGIAVCAISVLLTSPALANEDDYVLGIYGNANEDDTIDMRDLTYVKLIFFGKKPEMELADAKYDGKINPLDFIQIKLIIVGKEKELTIIDTADRIVTVKKPVERIIIHNRYALQTMRSLKLEKDRIAGVYHPITEEEIFFPEFCGLPDVGSTRPPDYEAILSLNPDFVITSSSRIAKEAAEKLLSVPVVCLYNYNPDIYVEETRKLGYIIDKKDEADEFLDFYEGWMDTINERVERISEEDRPKVYFETEKLYSTAGEGSGWHAKITMAGGNNIFGDRSGYFSVDPEAVITRDPEIIVKKGAVLDIKSTEAYTDVTTQSVRVSGAVGYYANIGVDESILIYIRNEVMNRPELAGITAVKDENVYVPFGDIMGGTRHFIGIGYMAKWFYPDLFSDLDPKAIHQEYLTRFQGLDYDVNEYGVFVYPPPAS